MIGAVKWMIFSAACVTYFILGFPHGEIAHSMFAGSHHKDKHGAIVVVFDGTLQLRS